MDYKKMLDILEKIKNEDYPTKYEHWGGAHLIITDDKSRVDDSGVVFVVTDYASELSWLVCELMAVHEEELDYLNKYGYYPGLGRCMNTALAANCTLKETMFFTAFQGLLFWLYPPEIREDRKSLLDIMEEKIGPVPELEDDRISIGQILRSIEEGHPVATDRNKAMHEWIKKAMNTTSLEG